MRLLNGLFSSPEALAKDIVKHDLNIHTKWWDYEVNFPNKIKFVNNLSFNNSNRPELLKQLSSFLDTELVDVNVDEKDAKEIISDFDKLGHEKRLSRVKKLDDTVAYAQTKYVHVYELLKHIFSVLVFEAKLIEKLNSCSNEKDFSELVAKFKSELQIEQEAISQIQNLNTFGVLFSSLVRAEHIVKVLTSKEKRYLYHMEKRMKAIFGNNVESGITLDWMGYVYQEVGKRIEDLAAQQILSSSTHADFEYVNRPEFVALVHEVISGLREDQTHKKAISAEMEAAFVHLFREWFNHERN